MIQRLKEFWSRLFTKCLFCEKIMLWAPCLVYLETQDGSYRYPTCYYCMADYVRMTEEIRLEKEKGEGLDESL